jgi:RimJ/RimL family protein N-acetyltransferase
VNNITLRRWQVSDKESLMEFGNNPNIAKFMTNSFPSPYTLEKATSFIEFANTDEPIRIFAIDLDGVAIGSIGIHPQHDISQKNAELGYWLGEPFWGRGIMTKAIQLIIPIAFENYPIRRLFARPFGTNIASQKALLKAGFEFETSFEKTFYKDNEFIDELFYSIRRD